MKRFVLIFFCAVTVILAGSAQSAFKKHYTQGNKLYKNKKWAQAASAYKAADAVNQKHLGDVTIPKQFHWKYSDALMGARKYNEAIVQLEILLKLANYKRLDLAVYNMACSYAKLGKTKKAKKNLIYARYLGYKAMRHMNKDPDLKSLHGKSWWPGFYKQLKTRKLRGPLKLDTGFEHAVKKFHKALKSGNSSKIKALTASKSERFIQSAEVNLFALNALNQIRDLTFVTPVLLGGNEHTLAKTNCTTEDTRRCIIDMNADYGGMGGSGYQLSFKKSKGTFLFEGYSCSGGCSAGPN